MLYKIVHRQYGSTSYWCDSLEEAVRMLAQILLYNPEDKSQYYVREVIS